MVKKHLGIPFLLLALIVFWPSGLSAQTNIALGKTVHLVGENFFYNYVQETGVSPQTVTDGIFLPRWTAWNGGTVWWLAWTCNDNGGPCYIEIDLEETHRIDGFILQGETVPEENYVIEYWDSDSESWQLAWLVPGLVGGHVQTRPNPADDTEIHFLDESVSTNRLRVMPLTGQDPSHSNWNAVSELQAFGGDYCYDADGDGYGYGPLCIGRDVDDSASSCTTDDSTDQDGDGVMDCLDVCGDSDEDEFGKDWSTAVIGEGAVEVGNCTTDGATPCTFGDSICAGVDCDDFDPNEFPGQSWYPDCDSDSHMAASALSACSVEEANQNPGVCVDGQSPDGGWQNVAGQDCDDEDSSRFPGQTWYPDCDSDSHMADTFYVACSPAGLDLSSICNSGQSPLGGWANDSGQDCDDEDRTRYPGAFEIPADGIDQDCDFHDACYLDHDADGFGSFTIISDLADDGCKVGSNESGVDGDCHDSDPTVFPGAVEVCDGQDNSCDAIIPPEETDDDIGGGDGYVECEWDAGGWDGVDNVFGGNDCDDVDATVYPGATEITGDGVDQDCDASDVNPDTDTDKDSVPDGVEDQDKDGNPNNDNTDNDGLPNYLDTDDDDDGVLTINEDPNGNGDPTDDDSDDDFIPDYLDKDSPGPRIFYDGFETVPPTL